LGFYKLVKEVYDENSDGDVIPSIGKLCDATAKSVSIDGVLSWWQM
jgi:hypothetical protein